MILKLNVSDRTLTISQDHSLYSDGKNVDQVAFTFDAEWADYAKVAVFYVVGRDNVIYERALTSDSPIKIPNECLLRRGNISIGVVGTRQNPITLQTERITTNTFTYLVKSGMASFENYITPDDTLWDHYVALMDAATKKAEHANDQSEAIQQDVTEKWIDSVNRHNDIIERHNRIEELDADVVSRHTNILARHIDIQERNADIIELHDRTEFNTLTVKRLRAEIDEVFETIELRYAHVQRLHDEVAQDSAKTAANTQIVEDLTHDNYVILSEIRSYHEVINDRHSDVVKRHQDIVKQHEAIHREHHRVHEEVKKFEDIEKHSATTLSQMRRAVHEQGEVLSRVARHAREAAESEIRARSSEINALDSELSARDYKLRAEHEAHKSRHYARDAEIQSTMARQLIGAEVPQFYLDTETMSLYIKEPENPDKYSLDFKMIGNGLYWNFTGYENDTDDGKHFSNQRGAISP